MTEATEGWQRLDRRMLLIHPVNEIKRFFPALIGLVFAGSRSTGGEPWWWSAGAAAIVIALALLRWATTRYRFTADQVQLRHGLFQRKLVAASADRVRSVDVTSPPIHRVLGLAKVRIGTGGEKSHLELDGLSASDAAALRARLLHRVEQPAVEPQPDTEVAGDPHPVQSVDTPLLRLDPSWVRFAPLSPTGLLAAWAVVGVATQPLWRMSDSFHPADRAVTWLEQLGVVLASVTVAVVLVGVVVFVSIVAYLLAFHGFRLSRNDAGGTLHVSRGLLTTRATSFEIRRIRGLVLHEPVPLRWARGAHLEALATGVDKADKAMSSTLAPPAPGAVVRRLADAILREPGLIDGPVDAHGPGADRRRWTRALAGALAVAAALVGLAWWIDRWAISLAVIPVIVGAGLLARDRANRLGHRLTDRFLVIRLGGLGGRVGVIERTGTVAVTTRSSWFQRRAGLATVEVATAAGKQSYVVPDVPLDVAERLTSALLRPGETSSDG